MKRHLSLDNIRDDSTVESGEGSGDWIKKANKKSKGKSAAAKPSTALKSLKDILPNNDSGKLKVETCVKCNAECDENECLKCEFCSDFYHASCVGLNIDLLDNFRLVIRAIGWSCQQCKSDLRQLLGAARLGVATGGTGKGTDTEDTSSGEPIHAVGGPPDNGHNGLATGTAGLANTRHKPIHSDIVGIDRGNNTGRITAGAGEVERLVRIVVGDANRRKMNVVISGLKETPGVSDEDLLSSFCEHQLGITLVGHKITTRRLGTPGPITNKPRRLLARLGSEQLATSLLQSSRLLRNSGDIEISRNVFINPDRSPSEEKEAYDRRQARRMERELHPRTMITTNNLSDQPAISYHVRERAQIPVQLGTVVWNSNHRRSKATTPHDITRNLIVCTRTGSDQTDQAILPPESALQAYRENPMEAMESGTTNQGLEIGGEEGILVDNGLINCGGMSDNVIGMSSFNVDAVTFVPVSSDPPIQN